MHLRTLSAIALLLTFSVICVSQESDKGTFDVSFRILVGSNSANNSDKSIPKELVSLRKSLMDDFGVSSVSSAASFQARSSEGGSIDSRSLTSFTLPVYEAAPVVINWNFEKIKKEALISGNNAGIGGRFRFSANVPIRTLASQDPKNQIVLNYEQIRLTLDQVSVYENSPAFLGSLSLPGSGEILFLFLTVREIS